MKTLLLLLFLALPAVAKPPVAFDRLADAIRIEEGANSRKLYGVEHPGERGPLPEPEARRRCLTTLEHAWRDWDGSGDFITFLSRRYCPPNSQSWARNVRLLLKK